MLLAGAALLASTAPALAIDFTPRAASAQLGTGRHGTQMAGVGLIWDWNFERVRRSAALSAQTEVMISRWRYHAAGGGHDELTQLAVVPSLRMRLDRGASPTFLEFGIGLSWFDRDFATDARRFSTRWNFYDMVGIGHTYGGAQGQHEVGLRLTHISNGGIRHPNPGQNFLQLRYAYRF